MAKTFDPHIADTPVEGSSTITVTIPALNWKDDWVVTKDTPGEVLLSYLPAPVDAPTVARFAAAPVRNIYAGTDVEPAYQGPYRKGISIVRQLQTIGSVTDDSDSSFRIDPPRSIHTVYKAPTWGLLTVGDMRRDILRSWALWFDKSLSDDMPLTELLKGRLKPDGM